MIKEKTKFSWNRQGESYYNQEEWLEEFLDDKGVFADGSESDDSGNDDDNCTENTRAVVCRCSSK